MPLAGLPLKPGLCHAADGRTPLHLAALKGHAPVVEFLLDKGVWADAFDGRDDAPLHLAARQGQLHAVQVCWWGCMCGMRPPSKKSSKQGECHVKITESWCHMRSTIVSRAGLPDAVLIAIPAWIGGSGGLASFPKPSYLLAQANLATALALPLACFQVLSSLQNLLACGCS
jgi:hypothetical protein